MAGPKGHQKFADNAVAITEVGPVHGKGGCGIVLLRSPKRYRFTQRLLTGILIGQGDAERDLFQIRFPIWAGGQESERETRAGQSAKDMPQPGNLSPVQFNLNEGLLILILSP